MDATMYMMGGRMHDLMAQNLEIAAVNLANANTPGYKRVMTTFRAALEEAGSAGGTPASGIRGTAETAIDLSPGGMQKTGRPLDVAVSGEAFLVVETPKGQRYTRKGRLYLSPDGDLTDGQGNPFASSRGSLSVPADAAQVTVSKGGEILADGRAVGTLMLMDIPKPEMLASEGASLYRNDGPPAEAAADSSVIGGAIEGSNVQPVREMVSLIGVMKAYETGARLVKRLDSLSGQLIKTASQGS